jgi:hypothetical protein
VIQSDAAVRPVSLVLGLVFALVLETETVFSAVEKWESRRFCGIPKGVWEAEETCFWFSPVSMLPPFPRRFGDFSSISFAPSRSNRPTTWGPNRIETVSSRCSWIVTVLPASVFRNRVLSICQNRAPIVTVLSLSTTRSVCTVKIQFRSLRLVRRNAVPFSSAATRNFSLNSPI